MRVIIVNLLLLLHCYSVVGMQENKKLVNVRDEVGDTKGQKKIVLVSLQNEKMCGTCNKKIGLYSHSNVRWPQCYDCNDAYLVLESVLGPCAANWDKKK